jgi:hypothetical protein
MARGGKKNAARFTRPGAVIGAAKPAAAKTTLARRLPAADEDTAARAAAMARLAEKIKLLEAELKAAQGPDSKRTLQQAPLPNLHFGFLLQMRSANHGSSVNFF